MKVSNSRILFLYENLKVVLVLVSIGCCFARCCKGCSEGEMRALLQMIETLREEDDLFMFSNWRGRNCCEWVGIKCSKSVPRVINIDLSNTRDISKGPWHINATLFAQFKLLQEIRLSSIRIIGSDVLQGFCELRRLQTVVLNDNSIEGSLPSCLGNLNSLKYLDISKNQIQGKIPFSILSNLNSLEYLDISENQIQGKISFSILSNFTTIETINLGHNQFQGVVPLSVFANGSKLRHLDLSHNPHLEVETESTTWDPSFQLYSLCLANCNLNKGYGSRFPRFIRGQYSLNDLDLSQNSLIGSVPQWLTYNHTANLHLRLRSNKLGGRFPLPRRNKTSQLRALDISDNHFSGPLPSNINTSYPNLYYLNVSKNGFLGTIPKCFGELSDLQTLDLSNNNFYGEIPPLLTINRTKLIYLSLANNNLQGEMLPRGSNMPALCYLLLSDNNFTGMIPNSLSNSRSLMILDVRNNNLFGDLSRLPDLPDLGALLFGGNHFESRIPRQLCKMQNIQFLDLSSNHLSGAMPSCLNSIIFWKSQSQASRGIRIFYVPFAQGIPVYFRTKGQLYSFNGSPLSLMIGIDVSSNKLTGTIPNEMGDLREILSLNMSYNFLTGPIPISFQNLENIESLDFSHNNFIGTIPPGLVNLHALSTFNVSFNRLAGRIPFEGQFHTFSSSSYMGNLDLCGQPLELNCSHKHMTPSYSSDGDEAGEDKAGILENDMFFYSFVAVSYALGFWAVIAIILFNQICRCQFFEAADGCMDLCQVKLLLLASYLKSRFL